MRGATSAYLGFAAYGLFWGTWGAALPALRDSAAVDESALGTALLFVGAGALPAMLLVGRAVDRFGSRIGGVLLILLAVSGMTIAAIAHDLLGLIIGMTLVGASSGAADVAINAQAGLVEQRSGRRVITVAHGVFSASVVLGSAGAGGLRSLGFGPEAVFLVAGAALAIAGVVVMMTGDRAHRDPSEAPTRSHVRSLWWVPFVGVGLVGALGFAIENAHQSWSAIFVGDELGADPAVTALAPATFALFAAATRFTVGALPRLSPRMLLIGGAALAAAGTLLVSTASTVPMAIGGLAMAAIGTAVLYPTLLSEATRDVSPAQRGRATSAMTAISYIGFILGPVYVGLLSTFTGMRGSMVGVATLAVIFAVLAPLLLARRNRALSARLESADVMRR